MGMDVDFLTLCANMNGINYLDFGCGNGDGDIDGYGYGDGDDYGDGEGNSYENIYIDKDGNRHGDGSRNSYRCCCGYGYRNINCIITKTLDR